MVEWRTQNVRWNGSIWRGTSHTTPKECYQYTTSVDINNACYKRIQSLIQNHMLECREQYHVKAMNNNNNLLEHTLANSCMYPCTYILLCMMHACAHIYTLTQMPLRPQINWLEYPCMHTQKTKPHPHISARIHAHTHIIIMHIYHALINALSAHIIHINLDMIFYTHVEHSPTKTIYMKYYTKTKHKKGTTNTHTQWQHIQKIQNNTARLIFLKKKRSVIMSHHFWKNSTGSQ